MIRAHIEALTTKFSEHRIDYTLLNTAEPLDRALFSYLSSRERLMRVQMRVDAHHRLQRRTRLNLARMDRLCELCGLRR